VAESRLITAYVTELRYSVARLADADDIAAEAEDHLVASVEAAVARGLSRSDAEVESLARFGSAQLVARVFTEEAKRGGAVSTRVTRQAGVAAMLVPLLLVVGEFGNQTIDRGALHGAALAVLGAGLAALALALWGLRRRHGGLGGWGRASFWLFVASPFIAAPFAWGAGVAFLCVQLLVLTLLGIGMIRARILPRFAVALFTFTPAATLLATAAVSAGSGDAGPYLLPTGIMVSAVGLGVVGLALWREPALDMRANSETGPLAPT
jgi:hypothetical protein